MDLKDIVQMIRPTKSKRIENPLKTVFSEKLEPDKILQEYPRPQLKREQYTILNGYWDCCITKEHDHPESYKKRILVPFSPECQLSGVNHVLQPHEVLWYRRKIYISSLPKYKRCLLHFGAVDQRCQVYINGYKVTDHIGGYLAFECEIQRYLSVGENVIVVKVMDETDCSYHSRGKQSLTPHGMFYSAQSGIWQTVWLEWVPIRYIKAMKVTPVYDMNRLELVFKLSEHQSVISGETSIPIRVVVKDQEEILVEKVFHKKNVQIVLPKLESWTPENPYLYQLEIQYGEDHVTSYFAMRKISVVKDKEGLHRIYLNNQPYYERGILDQGYWPESLYTAPSEEAIIYDIKKMKELGYNMIRKHSKIEPCRWYYQCDRIGMLVWQDIVNGGERYKPLWVSILPGIFPKLIRNKKDNDYTNLARKEEYGREEWRRECWNTVTQLYHFPCIVTWVLFNEGWGQFDSNEMVHQIKKHDPSRLVDQASGWFDQGGGNIKSIHNYIRRQEVSMDHRAYAITEFGGYACRVPNHVMTNRVYGYGSYQTIEQLNEAYQKLYREEITPLVAKGLSATVYTQFADIEDEVNGLMTYDRKLCKVQPLPPIMHNTESEA